MSEKEVIGSMRQLLYVIVLCVFLSAPVVADIVPYGTATLKYGGTGPSAWANAEDTILKISSTWTIGIEKLQVTSYLDNPDNPDDLPGGASSFASDPLAAFCIDFQDFVYPHDTYEVDVDKLADTPNGPLGPMGALKAGQIAWLLDNNSWGLDMDGAAAAAMQLAIWEIVNEKTASTYCVVKDFYHDVDKHGNFFSNSSGPVRDAAQALLDSIPSGLYSSAYSSAGYAGLSNLSKQDFVVRVPVPGAVLLGMLGLGYAGMRLRRTRV